jgi:hypothetical protein
MYDILSKSRYAEENGSLVEALVRMNLVGGMFDLIGNAKKHEIISHTLDQAWKLAFESPDGKVKGCQIWC